MNQPTLFGMFGKRRILLTDKRSQLALIAYSTVFCIFGIVFTHFLYRIAMPDDGVSGISGFRLLALISSLVAIFATYLYFGLLLTNRMIGPLIRLQRHMRGIANKEGEYTFVFREKDFFPELEEAYNLLLASIQKQELQSKANEQ